MILYRSMQRIGKWGAAPLATMMAALTLVGCVNYAGIKSDKHIDPPSNFETTESLPAEGGQWPSLDWAQQFGDPQITLIKALVGGFNATETSFATSPTQLDSHTSANKTADTIAARTPD